MGRASRRKTHDRPMQLVGTKAKPNSTITLQNPVQDMFPAFIFGNALKCEAVVEPDSAAGQHLILCGAGPSLAETAAAWCPKGDQVWGCNSALIYLHEHGHQPTHGFTVDQTAETLGEWASTPDVEYLVASTVHPHLVELLQGRGRRTRFFHNYVGIRRPPIQLDGEVMTYEDWLYQSLNPTTIRTGSGLNSVNRAIDLAIFMGFAKITVLGADCAMRFTSPPPPVPLGSPEHSAWMREEVTMHADGGHGLAANSTALTLWGQVDGREWLTKPDMIISAGWLEKTRQKWWPYSRPFEVLTEDERRAERAAGERVGITGRVELIGDTLPVALKDKPDEYLQQLPTMTDGDGNPMGWL